jgi:prepilin-type N-terminal cleavage/methylation domain-containing protein
MRLAVRTRGLTLLELLIVLAILSVISGVLCSTSVLSQRVYVSAEAFVHVQQQARSAFDAMTRELREAGGAIAASGGQIEFQAALGYGLPAPCPPDAVCWGARDAAGADQAGWRIRYRLLGTQLLREVLDAGGAVQPGTRVLANDVAGLLFTYVGGTAQVVAVQLQVLQASAGLPGGSMSTTPVPLLTSIRLRNS